MCVGFLNQKFFVLYLAYFLGSLLLGITPFLGRVMQKFGFLDLLIDAPKACIVFLVSLCMVVAALGLLSVQLWLISRGITHLEMEYWKKSPFRQRSFVKNLKLVMGPRVKSWWNPFEHPFTQDATSQSNAYLEQIESINF